MEIKDIDQINELMINIYLKFIKKSKLNQKVWFTYNPIQTFNYKKWNIFFILSS